MGRLHKVLIFMLFSMAGSQGLAQVNMGAIGDSLTDEYLAVTGKATANDLAANSWLQILATTRGADFNFGAYNPDPDPASNWGGTRDSGYEYNFAKSGGVASNNTMANYLGTPLPVTLFGSAYGDAMASGLAVEIANGNVDTAFVGLGSNDYFYRSSQFTDANGTTIQDPALPAPGDEAGWALWQEENSTDIANSILGQIDTLQTASVGQTDIIVGLIPLGTASGDDNPDIIAAIELTNAKLLAGLSGRDDITVVDLWAWTDPNAGYTDEFGNVTIDDLMIMLNSQATAPEDLSPAGAGACNSSGQCATASHATKYIADDGLHPNTAIQALMANEIIKAVNQAKGTNIALLSNAEIIALTGAEVPLPAAAWLFASALALLFRARRAA